MSGPWDRAIADAAEDSPAGLLSAARAELCDLWYDLGNARRAAINGSWSMQCDNVVVRIVHLSRLAGVTPWQQIPIPSLLDGTYQGVLSAAGLEFEPPDMDEVRRLEAVTR